jgi:hypothetical protein
MDRYPRVPEVDECLDLPFLPVLPPGAIFLYRLWYCLGPGERSTAVSDGVCLSTVRSDQPNLWQMCERHERRIDMNWQDVYLLLPGTQQVRHH